MTSTAVNGRPRARDLGLKFGGVTGPLNAITDVTGVRVGSCTVNDSSGARTGVTAIFPGSANFTTGVAAASFDFNGTGELTGAHQIREYGGFFGPVLLTGTLSVGLTSDSYLRWVARTISDQEARFRCILPVVAETWDGNLNDAWGFHLRPQHVEQALESACTGPVTEGSVGGGTGMVCHGFKGGIGSSSRQIEHDGCVYTIGALVQANHGQRADLQIMGKPVGRLIQGYEPEMPAPAYHLVDGSIIVVLATDMPLQSAQLERVAKRATIGVARVGGFGGALSGEIFLAFSTASQLTIDVQGAQAQPFVSGDQLDDLFHAAAWATEEAIINALVAARSMTAANGVRVHGLPHQALLAVLENPALTS